MPSRNIVKTYVENGYYHIYNRGIEKREIFLDEQDCRVFLHYLKVYLSPIEELIEQNNLGMRYQRFIAVNLSSELDLLAFTLMPNHIHLLVKQTTRQAIIKFMRRLSTAYVMYFNKKYARVGSLFQNAPKAILINKDEYLLHLSRYIHLNATKSRSAINFYNYSSYPYYLGNKNASWLKPKSILDYFKSAKRKSANDIFSYQSFVEDSRNASREILGELILEDDN
ncbi:transposase [Candidatus Curtissbacteria bacterium]|nr:transposase [Candidatus Curtissbacteria bacterium]